MLVSAFDYHLPEELIAQAPLADRAASRMLHLARETGRMEDRWFRELPDLLRPDDLVVFNDTRVFPARLYGHRSGARSQPVSKRNPAAKEFLKGRVEVLLTGPVESTVDGLRSTAENPLVWNALVRPGRKIGVGEKLFFGENRELRAEVIARGEFGERTLRFEPVEDFFAVVERIGHVPLPPYIARPDAPADRERYQTVYARARGSVAAPTAGLHFTPGILERMRARGMETAEITLHVGLGTFQPVHAEKVEEHKLHREWYRISEEAAAQINGALAAGRRVVAVGTTTVRTLEYAALSRVPSTEYLVPSKTVEIAPGSGEADIFIYPGFEFRIVGAMLTNFHLPKSTLLMLVSAFAGREQVLSAYKHAVEKRYRFYSYGDCMFVEKLF
ncbi:MAG: tRNA preQ1(34) S-adenosylmethionine ribosyltransferase-isomerase QueA [Acidobacteriia bacterium]|nr:tRNA preQ1(34) S-adenosylmethionine ribosyltransferase-isomerase QueA [Terriglobia bacterium]